MVAPVVSGVASLARIDRVMRRKGSGERSVASTAALVVRARSRSAGLRQGVIEEERDIPAAEERLVARAGEGKHDRGVEHPDAAAVERAERQRARRGRIARVSPTQNDEVVVSLLPPPASRRHGRQRSDVGRRCSSRTSHPRWSGGCERAQGSAVAQSRPCEERLPLAMTGFLRGCKLPRTSVMGSNRWSTGESDTSAWPGIASARAARPR